MRKAMVGILTALAINIVATPGSVEAGRYCGAASYSCCPTQACQPAACYTTCRVERQQCERTVYSYVQEPQQYMVSRTIYDTVYEDVAETRHRTVQETAYREEQYQVARQVIETSEREEQYTVMRPVTETLYREHCYTVKKPVWEESTREVRRCVQRPVTETIERECRRTVIRTVSETVNQERCYTVMEPVTTYRTVRKDCGRWTWQRAYNNSFPFPGLTCDDCGNQRWAMIPRGFYTMRPQWCPNIVESQVACTTYQGLPTNHSGDGLPPSPRNRRD
jgi:YTV